MASLMLAAPLLAFEAEAGFEELFERAGLVVRRQELEQGMPRGLLPVRMWALAPRPGDGE
jgi:hypothetical protein